MAKRPDNQETLVFCAGTAAPHTPAPQDNGERVTQAITGSRTEKEPAHRPASTENVERAF